LEQRHPLGTPLSASDCGTGRSQMLPELMMSGTEAQDTYVRASVWRAINRMKVAAHVMHSTPNNSFNRPLDSMAFIVVRSDYVVCCSLAAG
jgi:hypothetical protein